MKMNGEIELHGGASDVIFELNDTLDRAGDHISSFTGEWNGEEFTVDMNEWREAQANGYGPDYLVDTIMEQTAPELNPENPKDVEEWLEDDVECDIDDMDIYGYEEGAA